MLVVILVSLCYSFIEIEKSKTISRFRGLYWLDFARFRFCRCCKLDEKVRREQTICNTIDSAVFTTPTKSESGKIEPEKPSESTYDFNFSNFDEGIAQNTKNNAAGAVATSTGQLRANSSISTKGNVNYFFFKENKHAEYH